MLSTQLKITIACKEGRPPVNIEIACVDCITGTSNNNNQYWYQGGCNKQTLTLKQREPSGSLFFAWSLDRGVDFEEL
jgi:hypothetical protein